MKISFLQQIFIEVNVTNFQIIITFLVISIPHKICPFQIFLNFFLYQQISKVKMLPNRYLDSQSPVNLIYQISSLCRLCKKSREYLH